MPRSQARIAPTVRHDRADDVARDDPLVAAQVSQARATMEVAKAINRAVDTFAPAANTIHGFGDRLDALCTWLRKKGPWILASIPGVLVGIQAISPQVAKGLQAILTGLGAP